MYYMFKKKQSCQPLNSAQVGLIDQILSNGLSCSDYVLQHGLCGDCRAKVNA